MKLKNGRASVVRKEVLDPGEVKRLWREGWSAQQILEYQRRQARGKDK
jgi:hypothetical protein